MLFPLSGVEVAWYVPSLAAFSLSFFTSMAGLSGAFLLLPFQTLILGYSSPAVSATNQFYNLIAIPNAIRRFHKEKRFHIPFAKVLILGAFPGVIIGVCIRSFLLTNPKDFSLYAAAILLYLSGTMIYNFFKKDSAKSKITDPYSLKILEDTKKYCSFFFDGKEYSYSTYSIFTLSFITAIFGGIYGIGGGAFTAPLLISFYKLPIYVTAAATLLCTLLSSCVSVALFFLLALIYPENSLMPDFLLGAFLGIGGLIGMTCGAITQKYVSARLLNLLIIIVLLITSILWISPSFT